MAPSGDSWSKTEILQLIELYKRFEFLYDVGSNDYKDRDKRNAVFKQIGLKLGKTGAEARQKMERLRSQLLAEIRKEKKKPSGSGTGEAFVSKWWLFGRLEFLRKYLIPRNSICSFSMQNSNASTTVVKSPAQMFADVQNGNMDDDILEEIDEETVDDACSFLGEFEAYAASAVTQSQDSASEFSSSTLEFSSSTPSPNPPANTVNPDTGIFDPTPKSPANVVDLHLNPPGKILTSAKRKKKEEDDYLATVTDAMKVVTSKIAASTSPAPKETIEDPLISFGKFVTSSLKGIGNQRKRLLLQRDISNLIVEAQLPEEN